MNEYEELSVFQNFHISTTMLAGLSTLVACAPRLCPAPPAPLFALPTPHRQPFHPRSPAAAPHVPPIPAPALPLPPTLRPGAPAVTICLCVGTPAPQALSPLRAHRAPTSPSPVPMLAIHRAAQHGRGKQVEAGRGSDPWQSLAKHLGASPQLALGCPPLALPPFQAAPSQIPPPIHNLFRSPSTPQQSSRTPTTPSAHHPNRSPQRERDKAPGGALDGCPHIEV